MEAVQAREARPWPPARVATTLAGLILVGTLAIGGTFGVEAYQERQATKVSCAALQRPAHGLDTLSWGNGMTVSEASWAGVLTTWHEHLGPEEQRRVTRALQFVNVAGGAASLFHDVDEELRPAAVHLYTAIKRPTTRDVLDTRALAYVDDVEHYLIDTCGVAPCRQAQAARSVTPAIT